MKLVSWNVNGLRACVRKGFLDYFETVDADIFCVQETKLQEGQIDLQLKGYAQYWNYAVKKGYSGTAVFTKEKPLTVKYGVGDSDHEEEGRILTLEFAAVLPCKCVCSERATRFSKIAFPSGMGRGHAGILEKARCL